MRRRECFFNRFAAWAHKNPEKRVILVGHSMGTIVLNEVFRHIKNIPAHEVVYMAAACSITDFCDSAGRYLEKHPQTQFYNLCLHPRSEVDEDHLVVRGSLLVWIDQHFEGPRHFTNRTLGSFENAVIAYDDLPPVSNVHLKAFPHDGEKRNSSLRGPQTHGDFSGFKFWHPEFWKPCPTPDQEIYKRL